MGSFSQPDVFYSRVLQPSIDLILSTPVGDSIKRREEAIRTALQADPPDMSVIVGGEFNLSADSRSLPLKELASILAAKGRVLRNFPTAPQQDASVRDTSLEAFVAFDIAAKLDPNESAYIVDKATTLPESIRANVGLEITFLRDVLNRIQSVGHEVEVLPALQGRLCLLEARSEPSEQTRRKLLEQAIRAYDKALGVEPTDGSAAEFPPPVPEGTASSIGDTAVYDYTRADVLIGAATSRVELANFLPRAENQDKIRVLLDQAVNAAARAESLSHDDALRALVNLIWGNAVEDQAWLLHDFDKYNDAVVKFEATITGLRQKFRTDSPDLYQALLGKGRVLYRQATAKTPPDIAQINRAVDTLREGMNTKFASPSTLAQISYYEAGALYWMALAKATAKGLGNDNSWQEDLRKAEQTFQDAVTMVRQKNLATLYWPDWQLQWINVLIPTMRLTSRNPQEVAERYQKLLRLVRELGELDGGSSTDPSSGPKTELSYRRARCAVDGLEKLLVLQSLLRSSPPPSDSPLQQLDADVAKLRQQLMQRLTYPDLRAYLTLLSTRWIKSAMTRENQAQLRKDAQDMLADTLKSLEADNNGQATSAAWKTRLEADQALVFCAAQQKISSSAAFAEWQKVGREVCQKLNALLAREPQPSKQMQGEFLYFRIVMIGTTTDLLSNSEFNRTVPSAQQMRMWNDAHDQWRKIQAANNLWIKRAQSILQVEKPEVSFWYWGPDERSLFISGDVPANFTSLVSQLKMLLDDVRPETTSK